MFILFFFLKTMLTKYQSSLKLKSAYNSLNLSFFSSELSSSYFFMTSNSKHRTVIPMKNDNSLRTELYGMPDAVW